MARKWLRAGEPGFGPVCPHCDGRKHYAARQCMQCYRTPPPVYKPSKELRLEMQEVAADANTELGRNVKELRLSAGISADRLSITAGISRSTVYTIENGCGARVSDVAKLARALKVPAWKLLEPSWRSKLRGGR